MNKLITVSETSGIIIASTEEARNARDKTLAHAATVMTVNSNEESLYAADALKEVKNLTRLIEDARTTAKAPLLEKGRQIDALAKELTADLNAEATRISQVLGVWTAEQKRLADVELRKAQEEATKLVQQRHREEQEQRDREEAEGAVITPEARRLEQEKRDLETQQQIVALRQEALAKVGPRPDGIATRKTYKFEVVDAVALYEAAPYLVTLTPNNAAITSALKGLTGSQTLPGVRHWIEQTAIVR